MTRINAGIQPKELTDKHLLAEHREIKRIPNMVKSGRANLNDIPRFFVLGKGHVKFFYNKIGYLHKRYKSLHAECLKRNFNVTDFNDAFNDIPSQLYQDWEPEKYDRRIVKNRINSKLGYNHIKY